MADKYSTIQQHQPLRVPAKWDKQEKALIVQLDEIFDDIYRRFGRLRMQDMNKEFQQQIEDDEGNIAELLVDVGQIVIDVGNKYDKVSGITINSNGIDIDGSKYVKIEAGSEIDVESGADLNINAGKITVKANGLIDVKNTGGISLQNGGTFTVASQNFGIDASGNATFKGGGEFSGNLIAAGGTFAGTMSAACITSGTMSANRISGGSIDASNVTITNLNASNISTGTMSANKISGGTIDATNVSIIKLNASNIVSGELDASTVVVKNLDASKITTGTMSANKISGGSIDASNVTITNLNASNITSGSMSADRITTGTMSADRLSGGTIDGTNITVKNLDASKITSGTMSANKISGGSIDASNVTITNLNASNISSGTMSANKISGGTLTVGGNNNTNGQIIINNASGVQMGKISKDGIETSGNLKITSGGALDVSTTNFSISSANQKMECGNWSFSNTGVNVNYGPSQNPSQQAFSIGLYSNNVTMRFDYYGDVGNIILKTAAARHATTIVGLKSLVDTFAIKAEEIQATYIDYTNLSQSSSRDIKHNIEDMPDMGEALDTLRPVTYVYDDDPEEKTRYGLIYEEAIETMPDICTGDESAKAINYVELVPMLLKEIQSLRARVAALEARGGQ